MTTLNYWTCVRTHIGNTGPTSTGCLPKTKQKRVYMRMRIDEFKNKFTNRHLITEKKKNYYY